MKPILIIPPDTIDADGIKALNDNGICTVVAKYPEKVKFVDPLPVASSRNELEAAAIKLSRVILNPATYNNYGNVTREHVFRLWTDAICKGTALDYRVEAQEEYLQSQFDSAKIDETRKIAREEARAEAAAKKAAKAAEKKKRGAER